MAWVYVLQALCRRKPAMGRNCRWLAGAFEPRKLKISQRESTTSHWRPRLRRGGAEMTGWLMVDD